MMAAEAAGLISLPNNPASRRHSVDESIDRSEINYQSRRSLDGQYASNKMRQRITSSNINGSNANSNSNNNNAFTNKSQRDSTIVASILQSTAEIAYEVETEREKPPPSLNLFTTTPKNFTRFVSRIGPIVDFKEGIEDILNWKNPPKTIVAMVGWIVLCKYFLIIYLYVFHLISLPFLFFFKPAT